MDLLRDYREMQSHERDWWLGYYSCSFDGNDTDVLLFYFFFFFFFFFVSTITFSAFSLASSFAFSIGQRNHRIGSYVLSMQIPSFHLRTTCGRSLLEFHCFLERFRWSRRTCLGINEESNMVVTRSCGLWIVRRRLACTRTSLLCVEISRWTCAMRFLGFLIKIWEFRIMMLRTYIVCGISWTVLRKRCGDSF